MTLSIYNITLKSFEMRREENLLTFMDAVKEYFQNEFVESVTIYSVSALDKYMNVAMPGISFLCGLILQNYNNLKPEAFYDKITRIIDENQFDISMFHNENGNVSSIFENAIFNESPIASKSFLFVEKDVVDADLLQPDIDIIVQPEERPFEWLFLFYLFVLFLAIKFCSCEFKLKEFCSICPEINPPIIIDEINTSPSPPHSP